MQKISFMRHATPVSSSVWKGEDDDRPLSPEGETEASRISLPTVTKVFVSPAKRTQDTVRLAGIKGFDTMEYLRTMMDEQLLFVMKEAAETVDGDVLFIGHQGSFAQVLSAKPCELVVVKC